jgi:hypothetical protein
MPGEANTAAFGGFSAGDIKKVQWWRGFYAFEAGKRVILSLKIDFD